MEIRRKKMDIFSDKNIQISFVELITFMENLLLLHYYVLLVIKSLGSSIPLTNLLLFMFNINLN